MKIIMMEVRIPTVSSTDELTYHVPEPEGSINTSDHSSIELSIQDYCTESPSFAVGRASDCCAYLFRVSVAVPSASSAATANVSLRVG
jgi:hypothetical protein